MHTLQNEILVAHPFAVRNEDLKKSLILVADNGVGFIINKQTEIYLGEALDNFPKIDSKLYYGGEEQTDVIHFLHNCPSLEGRKEIAKGVYWGGNLEQLKLLIESKVILPSDVRFYAGYVDLEEYEFYLKGNWMKLHDKYADQDWIKSYLFKSNPDDIYTRALKTFGGNMQIFAHTDTPSLN